jgi:23S rRNA pseudouridine955/2504/2580 synthase
LIKREGGTVAAQYFLPIFSMSDHSISISEDEAGIRLDRWVKRHYPEINHAYLQKALRKGLIKLGGKKIASNHRLEAGQLLAISSFFLTDSPNPSAAPTKPKPSFTNTQLDAFKESILYRDDAIIVLNKAPGLAVQGGSKIRVSVDAMLDELRFGYSERPKLVHRLDKDTSGILLIARTAAVAAKLTEAFRDKTIQKTYWAVVVGAPRPAVGEVRMAITKAANETGYEQVTADKENSKPALTYYKTLKTVPHAVSWLEMTPVTGKMHQLRVHAQSLGTPILGDGKYGGKNAFIEGVANKLHLHATKLVLPKGITTQTLFHAPLPPHMQQTFSFFGFV